ncbi:MAG: PmoA family protein [Candidatus Synoicihabitans palmerolidicus]|nr:PmoA family protein [Candidatus Synoicihabitans palmerolidicus]
MTSEGFDRTTGHATRGRWTAMHGPTEKGEATVVIMGHPSNHDAPQRMRIWEAGKVFFNYVPAQEHDWRIEPGQTVVLRYRLVVQDGRMAPAEVEKYWDSYVDGAASDAGAELE